MLTGFFFRVLHEMLLQSDVCETFLNKWAVSLKGLDFYGIIKVQKCEKSPKLPLRERGNNLRFQYEIPPSFWGLFRSANREIYIEALLAINEEYQYSNYFLSREACLQVQCRYLRLRAGGIDRGGTEHVPPQEDIELACALRLAAQGGGL